MVGCQRAVSCGQRRAVQIGELIGMQADRQAEHLRDIEDARRFLDRESDGLAERVDCVGKPLLGDRRQHSADRIDISRLVALGFGWQGVRAEESRPHRHRPLAAESPGGAQLAAFGVQLEAIT
jgi:hypothetical protein